MFLNCLSLDLTVIDLISICIVHTEKILGRNFKEFRDADVQGRGVFGEFGHPQTRGRGVKKGQIYADVLYALLAPRANPYAGRKPGTTF